MGFLTYYMVFSASVCASLVDDQQYCAVRYRRLCQGKGRHVACQFPEAGPGFACENYSPIQFHNDLKHFITHYINRRRQRIASGSERVRGGAHLPKPEVMMMVEWDRELAFLAQRLADQCTFVHDDCRATVRFPYAGQTVGEVRWRKSSDSETLTAQRAIRRVFDAWWGERRRVKPHQLTEPFRLTAKGAVWGHFSQLAVWSLRAVGCGAVRHGTSVPRLLLVCDFSHTNMLGQRTLTPGPVLPCPLHTARRQRSAYPLLCGPVRQLLRSEQYDFEPEEEPTEADVYDSTQMTTGHIPRNVSRVVTLLGLPETPVTKRGGRRGGRLSDRPDDRKTIRGQTRIKDKHDKSVGFFLSTTMKRKDKTKGAFIDKLDHELERRKKVLHKCHKSDWPVETTPNWRHQEQQAIDDFNEPISTKRRKVTTAEVLEKEYTYRETVPDTTASSEPVLIVRHKWHQTRDRPLRPGANALLNIPVTAHTRRTSVVVMKLDREDVDQLFRDTGFNPGWIRQRL